jgi:hypothetical protein
MARGRSPKDKKNDWYVRKIRGFRPMKPGRIIVDARALRGTPGGVAAYTDAFVEHLPRLLPDVPIVFLRHPAGYRGSPTLPNGFWAESHRAPGLTFAWGPGSTPGLLPTISFTLLIASSLGVSMQRA